LSFSYWLNLGVFPNFNQSGFWGYLQNGLFYLSFVEGDPNKSGFQTTSLGDRSYFYFYNLSDLKTELNQNNFEELEVFKVKYNRTETAIETHTILIAKKKNERTTRVLQ